MSRWPTSVALIAMVLAGCGARPVSAGGPSATMEFGGLSRTYTVHAPPGHPTGLVLNLHGSGMDGAGEESMTNFDVVADANGLVVAYPDGIDKGWADGSGASGADRRGVDDVGFLLALTAKLRAQHGIDAGHVFVTGFSNGGYMTNRLACEHAELFAAIAPVSGTLGRHIACDPSRPVAVLEVHGTADPIVPFGGGAEESPRGPAEIVSAAAMVQRWRTADRCPGEPTEDTLPDAGDGTVAHRFVSTPCAAGTAVMFYQVDGGGHTWPGRPQFQRKEAIGVASQSFDASQSIGQFFLAHAR